MTWNGLLDNLAESFERQGLLAGDASLVLGVSGGADSTLLLHAMHALRESRKLRWTLHAAHMHHGLRHADADADAAFVRELAEHLDVPFHEERADIPAEVAKRGGSTEEVARQKRYEFLERVALKTGSECVAVAHHADDDAETILHRVLRGTGLRGLAGMRGVRAIQPGSRIRLIRPLLHEKRETILALCEQQGLKWRLDPSNTTGKYTRGRIRNEVMPMLRDAINPNVSEALLRLAEQARWIGTYLEDAAARTFDSLVISEGPRRVTLNTHALLGKQRIIQAEVLRRAISQVIGREQDLSFSHIEMVMRLVADPESGKETHLPGAIVARKIYNRLELRPLDEEEPAIELATVFLKCPGVTPLPQLHTDMTAQVCEVDAVKIEELRATPRPYEEWLDYERVQFPLLVRGRREGDRFWPLGAPGSKSLGDFLGDEKIDPALRARIGIVCDQVGPVWVMPLRIDERVKLRPTTRRALKLTLRENGSAYVAQT